jgi:kynureninase
MSFDYLRYRRHFPIFEARVYMATQCLGPLPNEALEDLEEYKRTLSLRSRALPSWLGRMLEVTTLIEQLLGAPPNSVALRDSATAGQASIAAALQPSASRDQIVLIDDDFHSSRYLWAAQTQRGFSLVDIKSRDGVTSTEEILQAITERVSVVALPMVSSKTGALLDVARISAAARKHGALLVLDAYQAVGIVPLKVMEMGVDIVVGGLHKWLSGAAGMGLCFLYVRPGLAEELPVLYPGWIGHGALGGFTRDYEPASGARRFQQGTPAMEPIYTSRAGLRLVLEASVEALRERSLRLTQKMREGALARGLPLQTPEARGGMLCFRFEGDGSIAVAKLASQNIDIDFRPDAGLRVSPHPCQTEDEGECVLDALAKL